MMKLANYTLGRWATGPGEEVPLVDASTGQEVARVSTGLPPNLEEVYNYARNVGGQALRPLTFHQRARLLKRLALFLLEQKGHLYELSYKTGATKSDSWIDIEGGIGNLFSMSSLGRRQLPDTPFCLDGPGIPLSKKGTFVGQHLYVPKEGLALHINAFNFPVWGMLEKLAVNLLAGVPAVVRPATSTSYLAFALFEHMVESKIFPEGSFQLLCGPLGPHPEALWEALGPQDVATFTGSAQTGQKLRSHPSINKHSITFNLEADSLNACVLGPDVPEGSENFNIFVREVFREMTVKAGQKCTAIRRIIVPQARAQAVACALKEKLENLSVGDPRQDGVRMGPLASMSQKEEVTQRAQALGESHELLYKKSLPPSQGAFFPPTLFLGHDPHQSLAHQVEAFGPVATILPYGEGFGQAVELVNRGGGALVSSIVTDDPQIMQEFALGCGAYHGRLLVLGDSCAKESTGHGSPLPQLVHGGPGRAGGGEEMGGLRGVHHYMQRVALQGHPTSITHVGRVYCPGARGVSKDPRHPFSKFFEELEIGETLITAKRTVTEADIVNFANLSWDHFYAHVDETSLEGTLFERRVAHGYFILSAAAGLFVKGDRGPVLANYGLEEFRFLKPVYAGHTICVHLSVKEKQGQDPRPGEAPRGIVKWFVDVRDQTNESVAQGSILTLVARKGPPPQGP